MKQPKTFEELLIATKTAQPLPQIQICNEPECAACAWARRWDPTYSQSPVPRVSDNLKCECGSEAVGGLAHSSWCPRFY